MAKSYAQLHLKYEDLFDVKTINGFAIDGSDFKFGPIKYDLGLQFLRTEIVPVQTQKGVQFALAHHLRLFHFDTSTKLSNFNIKTHFTTYNKSIEVKTNIQNLMCNFRLDSRPRFPIIPTFTTELTLPKFSFISQLTSPDFRNTPNIHINFSLFDKFGFQFIKKNNYDLAYAILTCCKISKTEYSLAFMHDQMNYLILRSKIKLRDNIRAGIKFQLDQNLHPILLLGYKMETNGYYLHSLVNSEGFINSYLKKKLTDQLDCIFTMSINHRDSNYQSGFGLSWCPTEAQD